MLMFCHNPLLFLRSFMFNKQGLRPPSIITKLMFPKPKMITFKPHLQASSTCFAQRLQAWTGKKHVRMVPHLRRLLARSAADKRAALDIKAVQAEVEAINIYIIKALAHKAKVDLAFETRAAFEAEWDDSGRLGRDLRMDEDFSDKITDNIISSPPAHKVTKRVSSRCPRRLMAMSRAPCRLTEWRCKMATGEGFAEQLKLIFLLRTLREARLPMAARLCLLQRREATALDADLDAAAAEAAAEAAVEAEAESGLLRRCAPTILAGALAAAAGFFVLSAASSTASSWLSSWTPLLSSAAALVKLPLFLFQLGVGCRANNLGDGPGEDVGMVPQDVPAVVQAEEPAPLSTASAIVYGLEKCLKKRSEINKRNQASAQVVALKAANEASCTALSKAKTETTIGFEVRLMLPDGMHTPSPTGNDKVDKAARDKFSRQVKQRFLQSTGYTATNPGHGLNEFFETTLANAAANAARIEAPPTPPPAPAPPLSSLSYWQSQLSESTPLIVTTVPGIGKTILRFGKAPLQKFHKAFLDISSTTRFDRCEDDMSMLQLLVGWRGGDFRDDLDTYLNHTKRRCTDVLAYVQQKVRCKGQDEKCTCGKASERVAADQLEKEEKEKRHQDSKEAVTAAMDLGPDRLKNLAPEALDQKHKTILDGTFGHCAAYVDYMSISLRALDINNAFRKTYGISAWGEGSHGAVSRVNQARDMIIVARDQMEQLPDTDLVKGGFVCGLRPVLEKQFAFLDKAGILDKRVDSNDLTFDVILSGDGVPGLQASARNLAWQGATVHMGQPNVHSLQYIDILCGGILKESFAGYSYLVGKKLKDDLQWLLNNGFVYKGKTWHLKDNKFVQCNDMFGWWHCKDRMGQGKGNMQTKLSCLCCRANGNKQKNTSQECVAKCREEHKALLDGTGPGDYVNLFGLAPGQVYEVFCTMHGGQRITQRHITCILRSCLDIGKQAMVDAMTKAIKDECTQRFSNTPKKSRDGKVTYKCSGLPGPTAGKIHGGMQKILDDVFGGEKFKLSVDKYDETQRQPVSHSALVYGTP